MSNQSQMMTSLCAEFWVENHVEDRRATCTVSIEEGMVSFGLSLDFFMFFERSGVDFGDSRASSFPLQREEQLSQSICG